MHKIVLRMILTAVTTAGRESPYNLTANKSRVYVTDDIVWYVIRSECQQQQKKKARHAHRHTRTYTQTTF